MKIGMSHFAFGRAALDAWSGAKRRLQGPMLTAEFPMVELERPVEQAAPSGSRGPKDYVIPLFREGEAVNPGVLLWPDGLPERLTEVHAKPYPQPPVEVFCLSNVLIHGPGWVSRDKKVLFEPSFCPRYAREWYTEKRIYYDFNGDLSQLGQRRYEALWHVCHFLSYVYGHWLLECMPKLLVIAEFLRRWPGYSSIPVLVPGFVPPFVQEHIRALLPRVPIVTYDPRSEYISARKLFLPSSKGYIYHRWICEQLDGLFPEEQADGPKRIFVSRRTSSGYRVLDNRGELEQIAREEGLTVVYPEDLTFARQVSLFQNASTVVGEYGSALHNAIFSGQGTAVLALNWVNRCQSLVAASKGHSIGYLLPVSGAEVLFRGDGSIQHYSIEPNEFRAKVNELVAGVEKYTERHK